MNLYFVLGISILSILGMFICILKYPTLRIKGITIDTFYLPILFGAILLLCIPIFNKDSLFSEQED